MYLDSSSKQITAKSFTLSKSVKRNDSLSIRSIVLHDTVHEQILFIIIGTLQIVMSTDQTQGNEHIFLYTFRKFLFKFTSFLYGLLYKTVSFNVLKYLHSTPFY